MKQIEDFILSLSLVQKTTDTTNIYYGNSKESQIRRNNLKVYLTKMKSLNPSYLLLGEAPGYKGGRLSGIGFTSEKILFDNPFFQNEQIQFINETNKLESEISATIVWSEISKLTTTPLIWNIFPFHPHSTNYIQTNRTPTKSELEEGKRFLRNLLQIFEIKKIIALGKKPASQLTDVAIPSAYVRHPANGGKNLFIAGIKNEMNL